MSDPDPKGPKQPEAPAPQAMDPHRPVTMAASDFMELKPTDPLGPVVPAEEFVSAPRTMYAPKPLGLKRLRRRNRLIVVGAVLLVAGGLAAIWFLR